MKAKAITIILLFTLFGLAIFIRIYFSYGKIFSDSMIKYASDDGVYHMRLVENELLGGHFPKRIYFDPYTYFPHGTYIHFAPLYDQLLSGIIWLTSLGKPTLKIINLISPFYPVILGSLIVFLVYFIAKSLWDKKVALFSAFLIAFSPPYLFKSLLGATDHHVAEVLFSTLAMMFFIIALKTRKKEKNNGISNDNSLKVWFKNEIVGEKRFWIFSVLSGFSLGLYFLTWSGALLFLFILFVFIILYYLIQYFLGSHQNWILLMGVIIFAIVLIMIIPFFGHPDLYRSPMYNIQHLESLIFGILGFVVISWLGIFVKKKKINPWFLLVFLILLSILFLIILKIFFNSFFEGLIHSLKAINLGMVPNKLARELINEMAPLRFRGGILNFYSFSFLSLFALIVIFYKFVKNKKPEDFLLLVWTIIIMLVTGIIPFFGQRRFVAYLSVNVSLLSGFLLVEGFRFGWRGLQAAKATSKKNHIYPYLLTGSILIIFNSIFLLLYPFPFNISDPYPQNLPFVFWLPLETAKDPLTGDKDWYDVLEWLKNNTPDPGVDYYALYKEPGIDKKTGAINPYLYPKEAYGILATWDMGHMITYYAHRIPNANPFQQGIGEKEGDTILELGEAVFFLETEEKNATQYLENLRTRYVITDYPSAIPEGSFAHNIKWLQGNLSGYLETNESAESPSKFDNSMIARLHILDGRQTTTERDVGGKKIKFYIPPLNNFRLVYESGATIVTSCNPADTIKAIKVFEYVKGAKISGKTKPENKITISTEVETNQQRKFIYEKNFETKDGYFEFIVPYSTFAEKGRLPGQTQFSVFARPYKLKIGDKEIEVDVSEEDILEGKMIEINNL